MKLKFIDKYQYFVNLLKETIQNYTPIRKKLNSIKHRNPVHWWDEDCYKIKRLRRSTYKKWEHTKLLEDLIKYKKTVSTARKIFKTKKQDCFRRLAANIDGRNDITYMWKTTKILKNSWINNVSNNATENLQIEQNINKALDKLSPPWCITNPMNIPECSPNEHFDAYFNLNEFTIALDSRNSKSSPGLDGIDYNVIKKLPFNLKLILLDIYNEMYQTGIFPEEWTQHYVHFIKKSDGNVRPITLSSCLCKFLEVMIKNRLQWWVEKHQLLPESQNGFRKGRSCNDNLLNLTLYVEDGFRNKQDTVTAFLDISGAFDGVICDILMDKLSRIGCSHSIIKFVQFLMQTRVIHTDNLINNGRTVHKGVPQGGVMSPLLYIIYVADITKSIPQNVIISQFADDIAIYTKSTSLNKSKKHLELTLKSIYQELKLIGLELAPHKTVFIHFTKKRKLPENLAIKIDNYFINNSKTARFLGIIFDSKLTFSNHIDKIRQKSLVALNMIKYLRGTW